MGVSSFYLFTLLINLSFDTETQGLHSVKQCNRTRITQKNQKPCKNNSRHDKSNDAENNYISRKQCCKSWIIHTILWFVRGFFFLCWGNLEPIVSPLLSPTHHLHIEQECIRSVGPQNRCITSLFTLQNEQHHSKPPPGPRKNCSLGQKSRLPHGVNLPQNYFSEACDGSAGYGIFCSNPMYIYSEKSPT